VVCLFQILIERFSPDAFDSPAEKAGQAAQAPGETPALISAAYAAGGGIAAGRITRGLGFERGR